MNKQNSLNVNKRMIGKRVFIITDYLKYQGSIGIVTNVINDKTFEIEIDNTNNKISIYDIRSIPYEF